MPRTSITPTPLKGGAQNASAGIYTSALGPGTAADNVNFNQAAFSGSGLILVARAGAGAGTVTVTSAPDAKGRSRDITADAIAANAVRYYGPFPADGWAQADGNLYFAGSVATILFDVMIDP